MCLAVAGHGAFIVSPDPYCPIAAQVSSLPLKLPFVNAVKAPTPLLCCPCTHPARDVEPIRQKAHFSDPPPPPSHCRFPLAPLPSLAPCAGRAIRHAVYAPLSLDPHPLPSPFLSFLAKCHALAMDSSKRNLFPKNGRGKAASSRGPAPLVPPHPNPLCPHPWCAPPGGGHQTSQREA